MKRGWLWIVGCTIVGLGVVVFFWRDRLAEPGHNVVLIVVDTLRADHVSSMGYQLPTTPNLDALAAKGALFEQAFSNVAFSLPSFATLFTSIYPHSHGVNDNLIRISNKAVTLAEVVRQNGWQTAAIIGASNLHRAFGLHQGFEYYDDRIAAPQKIKQRQIIHRHQRRASEVNERAIQWLKEKRTRKKFFLFVHYFDPHHRYNAPPPFHTRFQGAAASETIASYDGEVAYVDDQIGRLLRGLEDLELLPKTFVIVTSDHGEGLGDHGRGTHGGIVYDEQLHVPLIVYGPGVEPGKRISNIVQLVDVAPSILELLKVPGPPSFQGNSFVPATFGKSTRDYAIFERSQRAIKDRQWAVRTQTDKVIWTQGAPLQYFDLKNDPRESRDVYETNQPRAHKLFQLGKRFRAKFTPVALAEAPTPTGDGFEPLEAMKALGYLNMGKKPQVTEKKSAQ